MVTLAHMGFATGGPLSHASSEVSDKTQYSETTNKADEATRLELCRSHNRFTRTRGNSSNRSTRQGPSVDRYIIELTQ